MRRVLFPVDSRERWATNERLIKQMKWTVSDLPATVPVDTWLQRPTEEDVVHADLFGYKLVRWGGHLEK